MLTSRLFSLGNCAMSAVRVKICGLTRIEDAVAAAEAGADAIGLVFYDKSPRAVSVAQARAIIAELSPFVTTVGLFVDASRCELEETLQSVALDMLQFHGAESPEECRRYGRPWLKALRVKPGDDLVATCQRYREASGLLLDAYQPGVAGGTGQTFDWRLVPRDLPRPLVLAGGLTVDNVAEAVAQVCPYAVDVSGGVESAKGIKDAARMQAFIRAARQG